ncbi:MAG: hypothetical protein IPP57_24405 [Candidatus Obscuribacter sp.]|jgi:hypothetical protein|nr:hypothetical protein [Candidatus Obscuribacter sp.]MBK9201209.1 hypothetical protein [Candidatus Obscuribacter sp.]MBK9621869.1 hypothetical protein [Candidatus Obscuribacter sp.]MBK9773920.1 hypothetical protein [Candidatus Obscuribacter sp.]MDQ5964921.1 hypothetical protein [Cyanobacteriota bacterium erpe_2018_sw_39hr_WHONDRS-SW48-000098_B_bin.30]
MPKSFIQITPEQIAKSGYQSEYILTLNLNPDQLKQRAAIEFSEKKIETLKYWVAALKDPDYDYVFELSSAINNAPKVTDISVWGQSIDPREAYTVLCQLLDLRPSEITWISESI